MRDSNFKGQKIFSVTVTESELELFSEFLQQREYAVVPSNVKKKLLRVLKPTKSQKEAGKRLSRIRINKGLSDPFFQAERFREISSPLGVTMPVNYL